MQFRLALIYARDFPGNKSTIKHFLKFRGVDVIKRTVMKRSYSLL